MNTTKQVNVMIGLLFMAFLVFGAYIATEPAREADARNTQAETMAKRGAEIFVTNCRSCHGMEGLGPDEGGLAPRLNNIAFLVLGEGNAFGAPPTPAGEARNVHDFLFTTLACGRSNTAMPVWSERYGGPLSDTQINYLTVLISSGRWDLVKEIGEHHDDPILERHAAALSAYKKLYSELSKEEKDIVDKAMIAGTATRLSGLPPEQQKQAHEALVKATLADPAKVSTTTKNCGQYGAAVLEARERNPFAAAPAGGAAAGGAAGAAGGDPVKLGQALSTQFACASCHSIDGKAGVGPTWKGLSGHEVELADGSKVAAYDAYLKESITNPSAKIVKGFASPSAMPATFATQLKPEQIDQLIAYIKSLK